MDLHRILNPAPLEPGAYNIYGPPNPELRIPGTGDIEAVRSSGFDASSIYFTIPFPLISAILGSYDGIASF
jgi:hypothetical protein